MRLPKLCLSFYGAAILALAGSGIPIHACGQAQNTSQQVSPSPVVPWATLQVTEKAGRFTVNAERADVQSVLKLLFDQADKQFTVDSTVVGQVTMRLNAQPLRTVVEAICAQTFLRWRYDPMSGIYRFERDEEAIKNAFSRIRTMNNILRVQLRAMGYDVPAENTSLYLQGGGVIQPQVRNLGTQNLGQNAPLLQRSFETNAAKRNPGRGERYVGREGSSPKSDKASGSVGGGGGLGGSGLGRGAAPEQRDHMERLADGMETFSLNSQTAYQQFLTQNNFVTVNIPRGQPEAVSDILLQLGKQANVPILLDPSVPNGPRFRIDGKISPRPLPDALNILSYYGRLEWRWIGDKIFVTTTPDFQLYFGESSAPRANSRTRLVEPQLRSKTTPDGAEKNQSEKKQEGNGE